MYATWFIATGKRIILNVRTTLFLHRASLGSILKHERMSQGTFDMILPCEKGTYKSTANLDIPGTFFLSGLSENNRDN